ncbi:MAG TPA: ATP-dependent DNA ligase [Streptosporangiaceae bacterium]|nr:ATP-dependent DNA ligase [Streptosporangiaceae bacterium]
MLLSELVDASAAVGATPARSAKVERIAALLGRVPPDEVTVAVAFLSGELRQGQIGVGYAAISEILRAADAAGAAAGADRTRGGAQAGALTLTRTDAAFQAIGAVSGPGSQAERRRLLTGLFAEATDPEREFLVRLLAGDLRQGALEGIMTDAVARAAGVPSEEVRRAHQLGGSLPEVALAALGGTPPAADRALAALRAITLRVGRPTRPMLAASAPDVATALERISPAAAEWKIDGIRVQVHRSGGQVAVFTRTLDDITARVPEIVEATRSLPVTAAVLDGEAVALAQDGRPRPFQVTAARTASQGDVGRLRDQTPLTLFLFDLLHVDGTDLIDAPGRERHRRLAAIAPAGLLAPRIVTADLTAAEAFFADAIAHGQEGLVLKSLDAPYRAGRRGGEWIKVKPRHTLDLAILAAEWGHGRRRGVLSNLHLGARDPETGGWVMLGKTFKGLTDEMLAWQTSRLLDLADPAGARPEGEERRAAYGVVRVRPELIVEVAFDGVQASRRYPGGLALRFARVLRLRPDKNAAEADTIDAVRAIWLGQAAP